MYKKVKGELSRNFEKKQKDKKDILVGKEAENMKNAKNMHGNEREEMWRQPK